MILHMTSCRIVIFTLIIFSLICVSEGTKKKRRCKPCGINEKRTKCPSCEFPCEQKDRMCAAVLKCQQKSVCQCLPGYFRNNGICVSESQCPLPTFSPTAATDPVHSNPTTSTSNNDNEFVIVKQKERHESYEQIDLLNKTTIPPPYFTRSKTSETTTSLPEDSGLIVISERTNKTIHNPATKEIEEN